MSPLSDTTAALRLEAPIQIPSDFNAIFSFINGFFKKNTSKLTFAQRQREILKNLKQQMESCFIDSDIISIDCVHNRFLYSTQALGQTFS